MISNYGEGGNFFLEVIYFGTVEEDSLQNSYKPSLDLKDA